MALVPLWNLISFQLLKTPNPKSASSIIYISVSSCFQLSSLTVCPHFPPFSPLSSELWLKLSVIPPLSFFQTLMMFLYTGISSGNGSLWLKLNYNDKAVAQCPRECQCSSWIEVKIQRDLKKSATGNILKCENNIHNVPDSLTEYGEKEHTMYFLMSLNIEKFFKTKFLFNTMIPLLWFHWPNL